MVLDVADPGILVADEEVHRVRARSSAARQAGSLERSRNAVLTAARPLPSEDDAVIEGLTDDEDRLFLTAIIEA